MNVLHGHTQQRRDTTANWNRYNPVLLDGELGRELTKTGRYRWKVGDGTHRWTELPYEWEGNAANMDVGTEAGTVAEGNDPRLSDARTPLAHAASHASGGSDVLTPADIGAQPHATALDNVSGTNTGDETQASIKTKLGAATGSADGYLTKEDHAAFAAKEPAIATGTSAQYIRGDKTLATFPAIPVLPDFGTAAFKDVGTTANTVAAGNILQSGGDAILKGPWVDVLAYADGSHTNGNLAAAIADVQTNPSKGAVRLRRGTYTVESTINITIRGIRIEGVTGDRGANGGSQISFTGTGECFQIGSDNGHAWDASEYSGVQGFSVENVSIINNSASRTTALNTDATALYAASSYGIRDWRGGSVTLKNVDIEGFEYNFWGIQSDFNRFANVKSRYSKFGIYAGPRSDQFSIYDLDATYCDSAVTVDGAAGVNLYSPKLVVCGSLTDYPVNIKQGSGLVNLFQPWLESLDRAGVQTAFVGIGIDAGYGGNTTAVIAVNIDTPLVATGNAGSGAGETKYLVNVGSCSNAFINDPVSSRGLSLSTNLTNIVAFAAGFTNTSSVSMVLRYNYSAAKYYTNLGNGTPSVYVTQRSAGNSIEASASGRFVLKTLGAVTGAEEMRISTEGSAGSLYFVAPTYATGQTTRFAMHRAIIDVTAMPTSGTYEAGDYARNNAPSVLTWTGGFAGLVGAKYTISGWKRLTTGSTHVLGTDWVEDRALTGA